MPAEHAPPCFFYLCGLQVEKILERVRKMPDFLADAQVGLQYHAILAVPLPALLLCMLSGNLAHIVEIKPPFAENSVRFLRGRAAGRHCGV
jgi:hypothetical protein